MTTVDPNAVQVLAQVFHRVQCLPGSTPYARYSKAHQDVDTRMAGLLLSGLHEAGYALTSKENQ